METVVEGAATPTLGKASVSVLLPARGDPSVGGREVRALSRLGHPFADLAYPST